MKRGGSWHGSTELVARSGSPSDKLMPFDKLRRMKRGAIRVMFDKLTTNGLESLGSS